MASDRVNHPYLLPLVILVSLPSAAGAQAPPLAPTILPTVLTAPNPELPLPQALLPQVEFWKAVYSRVSKDEVLFHDRERMDVVYDLYEIPEALTPEAELANSNYLEALRDHYRAVLSALGAGFDPDTLAGEARRLHDIWGPGTPPWRWRRAADNVRWQRGLREKFAEGLAYSGRFQPHVEQVFREEGVPLELTFLPFVESMYNPRARSAVGAAGVWQFMPGTGRLFMRVDGTIDERLDPIRAARAAARLLRQNYENLGTWPLAITAYNHGLYGMKNAVRTVGTREIETIVRSYNGRGFGFASRNFYAEFLAALEVRRNLNDHFADIRLDPALEFDEVTLPVVLRFSTLAQALAIPVEALWDMNPGFTPAARSQDRPVPAGHRLRLPRGLSEKWGGTLASLRARTEPPTTVRRDAPPRAGRSPRWYIVRRGDSLSAIADRHGTSILDLRSLNGLARSAVIHPGQRLRIPR